MRSKIAAAAAAAGLVASVAGCSAEGADELAQNDEFATFFTYWGKFEYQSNGSLWAPLGRFQSIQFRRTLGSELALGDGRYWLVEKHRYGKTTKSRGTFDWRYDTRMNPPLTMVFTDDSSPGYTDPAYGYYNVLAYDSASLTLQGVNEAGNTIGSSFTIALKEANRNLTCSLTRREQLTDEQPVATILSGPLPADDGTLTTVKTSGLPGYNGWYAFEFNRVGAGISVNFTEWNYPARTAAEKIKPSQVSCLVPETGTGKLSSCDTLAISIDKSLGTDKTEIEWKHAFDFSCQLESTE